MADKLKMMSRDIREDNIAFIGKRFPEAIKESKDENGNLKHLIDFDVLKNELSDCLITARDRYQMTWPDKWEAIRLADSQTTATLRPVKEKSVDFEHTKNVYIEGDNLEVLKILRNTYLNKIKMIYIDPPYNTGNDFIYNDNFKQSAGDYGEASGQYDEEGNRLITNSESNGRFHTDWLNMMYPRLKIAKDLLSDDGVIFISIDDNEFANLKKMCDEIFGEKNYVTDFPRVTKKGGKSSETYVKNHDYVLAYCKNILQLKINGVPHIDAGFKFKDQYFNERGFYKLNQTLDYNTLQYNKTMDYPIEINGKIFVPGGDINLQKTRHNGIHGKHDWVWRWSKELFDFGYKNDWVEISKTGRIYTKTYLNASISKDSSGRYFIEYKNRSKQLSTLNFVNNIFSNDNSNKEITSLMGTTLFDYVKPTELIKNFLKTASEEDSIILDFFSGSATTAHAVIQLNAEDGGSRKFIMVQLPEPCAESSEAYKAGYRNICEIGEERIRRAGKKIKEENPLITADLDTGFRVFRLASSNMKDVYYKPKDMTANLLADSVDNVKSDRTAMDLLIQVMLEIGLDLSSDIEERLVSGKKCFIVNHNDLVACFDEGINEEVITELAKLKPVFACFKDTSFNSDHDEINALELFKNIAGIEEKDIKVI